MNEKISDFLNRIFSMDVPVDTITEDGRMFFFSDGTRYFFSKAENVYIQKELTEIYRVLEEKIEYHEGE